MHLCLNCRHYRPCHDDAQFDKCAREREPTQDPVRGAVRSVTRYCNIERASALSCGPDAQFFVQLVETQERVA